MVGGDAYACPSMEITCPFCNKGKIKVRYVAPRRVTTRCRGSGTTKAHTYFTREKHNILSGCPICGKTRKEIDKYYKEGKQPSRKEIIKRAKEAGLPLKF